jgi:hypothetical protein
MRWMRRTPDQSAGRPRSVVGLNAGIRSLSMTRANGRNRYLNRTVPLTKFVEHHRLFQEREPLVFKSLSHCSPAPRLRKRANPVR